MAKKTKADRRTDPLGERRLLKTIASVVAPFLLTAVLGLAGLELDNIGKGLDDLKGGQKSLSDRIASLKTTTIEMREQIAGKFGDYDRHFLTEDARLDRQDARMDRLEGTARPGVAKPLSFTPMDEQKNI